MKFSSQMNAMQESVTAEAVSFQNMVLADPEFFTSIRALADSDVISWYSESMSELPSYKQSGLSPVEWFISELQSHGGYERHEIMTFEPGWFEKFAYRKTTALSAFRAPVKLHINKFDRGSVDIANTLLHERIHWIGQTHQHGQDRPDNCCDAAYVIGDLGGAMLKRKLGRPAHARTIGICPKLASKLDALGL